MIDCRETLATLRVSLRGIQVKLNVPDSSSTSCSVVMMMVVMLMSGRYRLCLEQFPRRIIMDITNHINIVQLRLLLVMDSFARLAMSLVVLMVVVVIVVVVVVVMMIMIRQGAFVLDRRSTCGRCGLRVSAI